MKGLIQNIQIKVNSNVYLKDPNSSELGSKIVSESILMISEVGLEHFTFKKLAKQLETTESSIYRYFENKSNLLIYLTSWFWGFMEYLLVFKTANLDDPKKKLELAIQLICQPLEKEDKLGDIDLHHLKKILISESSKAYLNKEVDESNKEGYFLAYKRFVARLSEIVLEVNPSFTMSHTLVSTIVEGVHHQKYFAEHLPALTDLKSDISLLSGFYYKMAIAAINNYE